MLSGRWRFQQLAKRFEVLVRDLNESEDTEQGKQYLLRMKAILNEVDELTTNNSVRMGYSGEGILFPMSIELV
jgi:hypothetical protein